MSTSLALQQSRTQNKTEREREREGERKKDAWIVKTTYTNREKIGMSLGKV